MGDGKPETTTIEVKVDLWAALDRRKDRGDSFDDVIRKLINQTPAPMGAIKEAEQPIKTVDTETLEDVPGGATCSHYDVITGETCGKPAKYLHTVQHGESDPQELYLCTEHGPDTADEA